MIFFHQLIATTMKFLAAAKRFTQIIFVRYEKAIQANI